MSLILKRNHALTAIAKKTLDLETLQTRNSDDLDFRDQAVWSIKEALEAAYDEGRRSALQKEARTRR